MKLFTLHKGKEHPRPCEVYYQSSLLYKVDKSSFSVDYLLEFLGKHSAELYEKEVLIPADYNYMSIEVKDWEIYEESLVMPVYVSDSETRRYMYRLDANNDIIGSVVAEFNVAAKLPPGKGIALKEISLCGNLIFTNVDQIIYALYKSTLPFIKLIVWFVPDWGDIQLHSYT